MDALSQSRSGSRSRRSSRPQTPTHFSLVPLTPRFPLSDYDPLLSADAEVNADADDYISAGNRHNPSKLNRNYPNIAVSTSYLTSTSVPTTPKILSRNSSRTRLNTPGPVVYPSGMTKSKSSAYLRQIDSRIPPAHTGISRPKSNINLGKPKRQDPEWLLRTGLALTTETREAKGQSWLAQRDSSTSLVSQSDEEDDIALGRGRGSRITKAPSTGTSPVLSRRGSRTRGGRGSDLRLTPSQSKTSTLRKTDSTTTSIAGMTPDFVDPQPELSTSRFDYDPDDLDNALADAGEDDDEDEDQEEIDEVEREMQRLTRERGFGLGGLVDRVLGWTLFENSEDDPSSARAQATHLSKTRSELETGDEVDAKAEGETDADGGDQDGVAKDEKEDIIREAGRPRPGEEGEVRWEDDAAWLIRVAGKIIL